MFPLVSSAISTSSRWASVVVLLSPYTERIPRLAQDAGRLVHRLPDRRLAPVDARDGSVGQGMYDLIFPDAARVFDAGD